MNRKKTSPETKKLSKGEIILLILMTLCAIFLLVIQDENYEYAKSLNPDPAFPYYPKPNEPTLDLLPNLQIIISFIDDSEYKYEILETDDGKCYYIHFQEEVGSYYFLETGDLILFNESEKYRELWEQLTLMLLNYYGDVGTYYTENGTHFRYDFDF